MPHLSDLRDELKEQKDEGLLAYIKEQIVVDEDKIQTRVATLPKRYNQSYFWAIYSERITYFRDILFTR